MEFRLIGWWCPICETINGKPCNPESVALYGNDDPKTAELETVINARMAFREAEES